MSYFADDDWENYELVSGTQSSSLNFDLSSLHEGFYAEDDVELRDDDVDL